MSRSSHTCAMWFVFQHFWDLPAKIGLFVSESKAEGGHSFAFLSASLPTSFVTFAGFGGMPALAASDRLDANTDSSWLGV